MIKRKPIKRRSRRRKRRSAASIRIELANRQNKRRYSKRYLELMNYIRLRDSYACQYPGCQKPKGVKLTIHHIKKWASNKALRQNKYNLISLCYACHQKVTGKEKSYETKFKIIARTNELIYKRNKKTKEQILEEQRAHQILPDDFESYQYKSDQDIIKEKALEYYLRKTWRLVKFRTQNKNSNSYKNYGGRGITMYPEWIESFEKFEKYVLENLGDRPEHSSIDRIDNNKGYEPGNIRWATAEVQGQNRRTTILDEETAAVILILHYKYKMKISQILNKMNLPSRSSVSGVVGAKTWRSVCAKYKKIITNPKALAEIEEYENNM